MNPDLLLPAPVVVALAGAGISLACRFPRSVAYPAFTEGNRPSSRAWKPRGTKEVRHRGRRFSDLQRPVLADWIYHFIMVNVLVALSDPRTAGRVAAAAAALTATPRSFTLVAVAPDHSTPFLDSSARAELDALEREGNEGLFDCARAVLGDAVEEAVLAVGAERSQMVEQAAFCSADLIVVGREKTGLIARATRLSLSEYLLDHAPCPVLVVHVDRD